MKHAWILAAALGAAGAAGCDHGHGPRGADEFRGAEERAADEVVRYARDYVDWANKTAGPHPSSYDHLVAFDTALNSTIEAAEARRVALRALHVAEDADVDPGRAARVKSSAGMVLDTADLVRRDAAEVHGAEPSKLTRLEWDRHVLKASLLALKVDVLAMEREAD
jgi:hypothetical protein